MMNERDKTCIFLKLYDNKMIVFISSQYQVSGS
jgi:hypothetical protein